MDNALFGLDLSNDATITAGGVYSLVFRGVDAAHVTTGNVPTSTSEPPDLTFTVYDDDREYSFLAGDRENTAQNGSSDLLVWGSALDRSSNADEPTLRTTIQGLLESAAPPYGTWEGAINGKIYGYLEGATHQVDLYLSGGNVAAASNFKLSDVLPRVLWNTAVSDSTRTSPKRFGTGDLSACNVLRVAGATDKSDNAFLVRVADDGNVPSDPVPMPLFGREAGASLPLTCGGNVYHLRPANGQPRVLYQLNNDAQRCAVGLSFDFGGY